MTTERETMSAAREAWATASLLPSVWVGKNVVGTVTVTVLRSRYTITNEAEHGS